MAKKGLSLFLCLCMLFSALSTIAYTNNSVILTGAALDDFLADSNSNNESSKNNTPDSTIGSTDFTVSSEIVVPGDYYFLDVEAPATAKPGETINVVFTIKNIKEELLAVEFFLDFDHTKVAPVITESEKPMDAFMTVYPTYTAEKDGQICELPAMEQICYYNSKNTQYELRFLDLHDYPGIVGDEPTMLINDGDLVVTVPFLVLDTVSEGDEFTFSLIEGTVWGVTAVGLNDVLGTGDSATVVIDIEDQLSKTPVDLGSDFYANINVPALNKTFTNNGASNVVADAANGSDAQIWHFVKTNASNAYTIASELDGGYIAIQGALTSGLANVYMSDTAQAYYIYSVNEKYVISPVGYDNKAIDVNGVDFNVQYWNFNAANACQQYDIVKVDVNDDTTSDDTSDVYEDYYYFLDVEAPETAKPGEMINVVFTIKNIKEELIAVEFFLDFDHTKVAPVITKSEKPMDAFMTVYPTYTAEKDGQICELPAMEQLCYYNSRNTQYELRFLDLLDYPGLVGDEPTMLVNDGDLVVTVPFLVLDTVSEGDEFTFSLIHGSLCGTTAVGLNDVPGASDSATVVVAGGTGNITPSGTCGENLTWTLDNEGTLTISGTGDMWDYTEGDSPWGLYKYIINSVTIQNGVTTIGDYAFSWCSLTSVIIGDSVTTIGDYAFYNCESLESITIPDSVTTIGYSAFEYCTSLESITIPDSVTAIGAWTFYNCKSLKSVIIPDSVTTIGDWALGYCKSLTSITIPDSVTTIGDYAFYKCESLESITIPDSVTTIGDYAFYNCKSLESITIPDSVTTIGERAFDNCKSLESITIPETVTAIGDCAFGYYYDDNWDYAKIENFTITGVKGSAAEAYAIENGFTFIALDITKFPENDFYMDEEALTMPNIAEGTKAYDIISTLAEYGITATVTDKNGNAIADNAVVSTGCVVKVSKDKEYVIIIWGDTDGNGRIDTTDYLKIKSTMYGINSLTGAYFNAADADDDGCITVTDYLKLKAYLLN